MNVKERAEKLGRDIGIAMTKDQRIKQLETELIESNAFKNEMNVGLATQIEGLEAKNEKLSEQYDQLHIDFVATKRQLEEENREWKRLLEIKCTAFCGHYKSEKNKARKEYEQIEQALKSKGEKDV